MKAGCSDGAARVFIYGISIEQAKAYGLTRKIWLNLRGNSFCLLYNMGIVDFGAVTATVPSFYLEYSAGICYNEHKMPMPIQAYAIYAWQQIERSGAHDGYAGLSVSFQHAESSV